MKPSRHSQRKKIAKIKRGTGRAIWGKLGRVEHDATRVSNIAAFFQEQPEYKPALLLFQNKSAVPRSEISKSTLEIFVNMGIITGQPGGKKFELSPAARQVLESMHQ